MKLIHCADVHLDSKMTANLDSDKAKERKLELLNTFIGMINYADEHDVGAIILAGDIFDTKHVSVRAKNTVIDMINNHPGIQFYYLKGNHDMEDSLIDNSETIPNNLHTYTDEWTIYNLELSDKTKVTITGVELTQNNSNIIYSSLLLKPEDINIVVLHGRISEYKSDGEAEVIDLGSLRNKNIDYLALGHIHEYSKGELLPRGVYCYPGCLEGRGFDECGDHGFVLLDIDEQSHKCTSEFVPWAMRRLYEIPVDVSGCMTTTQMQVKVDDVLSHHAATVDDMIKIVLTGEVDIACEKNTDMICKAVSDRYYFVKVYDKTKLRVDYMEYIHDASLKGELVRLIQSDDSLSEDEKMETIRCGIQALSGEEIEL